jgi:hypothetical protein
MEIRMPEHRQGAAERRPPTATRSAWQRLTGSVFGRDLTLVLALKVALLIALYLFVIRPALRPAQDPAATANAVAGATTAPADEVHP